MDFTKFCSLLSTRALYFPRADRLGDKFEGSFTYRDTSGPMPPADRIRDTSLRSCLLCQLLAQ